MTAQLIQAPDSKKWHVGALLPATRTRNAVWRPVCDLSGRASDGPWRVRGSIGPLLTLTWRTPRGVCSNCHRLVEDSVRLIAAEEERDG